ncbi:TonB-dependent receptor SusC [Hallella multisaccharivorax DSM 17128]|uniref:TonB-dependent receptor plug n=2 Tax=Hallella multisaccharivorax TaxID=310514 RepID=F8NAM8_9BACT|nr:TonB-dependent receptor plug [Hallella multisaccharivorax DSM 17128]GJG29325.1 TonB-dependent receptor SusC [Hallella multisaccharivorax DSM 17128]
MMKQVKFKMPRRALVLTGGLLLAASSWAQSGAIKGQVKDAAGEPVMGATITANGKAVGVTDLDGNYSINVAPGTEITISYIGMTPQKVAAANGAVITLKDDSKALNEVVVIGYGVAKKKDLTGSVSQLAPDTKNKGLVVNAQDMIEGKVAGVSVTSDGGIPGGGSTIRIRGGASLNASNNPLYVIDGIAMDDTGVKGLANPLSMINPQDIESFTVLKDASATAIYGSRGSNGVIIITTKKGHGGLKVAYNGSMTVSQKRKTLDVMDGDEYRGLIEQRYGKSSGTYGLLGKANTNWQDEIYRTALSQDHGVSVSGTVAKVLPFRVSAGYTDQQGILKTSDFKRYTGSLSLTPNLFEDHLKINVNVKGMWSKSRFANTNAVSAAVYMDPTHSVVDDTFTGHQYFNNYYAWTNNSVLTSPTTWYLQNTNAPKNPVALLEGKNDRAISRDLVMSGDVDYMVHGLEDLHLHATGGIDIAYGDQRTDVEPWCPDASFYGSYGFDRILKRNYQGSVYAMYTHDFNDQLKNHFDVMAGAEESHFWRNQHKRTLSYLDAYNGKFSQVNTDTGVDYDGDGVKDDYHYKTENYLVSYFGRANWSILDRYYLNATFRADGSSRFKKHWGYFPSASFMWKVKDESFLRSAKWLSELNYRMSYGQTGQQEGIGDYGYIANYTMNSGDGSYYQVIGNGNLARPNAYNPDITWETTTTYDLGLDWSVLDRRLSGSFDWYYRKTTDLLNTVTVPAGSNFRNKVTSNIGDMTNTGFEASVKWVALDSKDWRWTLNYNLTYNRNKITKLMSDEAGYVVLTGGISSGTGNNCQAQSVGHTSNAFYVYQQVYDKDGKPLEGVVVDRNGDGQITSADRYFYKSPVAPVTMGLGSRLEYKNWDLGMNFRASIGNYVFNDLAAGMANVSNTAIAQTVNGAFLQNRLLSSVGDNWQSYGVTAVLSDRWVQNASFLKCDNITLGYSFDNLFKTGSYHGLAGRVYGTVNNVFTITKYKGIDPEVYGGIDNNVYPRPISFIVGLSLNF